MCIDYIKDQEDELRAVLETLDIEAIQAETGMQSIADLGLPQNMNDQEAKDALEAIMEGFLFPIY